MNIFLVPYTWLRHLQIALVCAGAALLAWWALLSWFVLLGPFWSIDWDGPLFVVATAGSVAAASTFAEGNLRRLHPAWRVSRSLLSGAMSGGLALLWFWGWHAIGAPALFPSEWGPDIADPSLVSLRFQSGALLFAGVSTAAGPAIVRKGAGLVTHLLGGVAAGLAGGAMWHVANFTAFYDLYLAGALGAMAWGATFGLLAWGIPDSLYTGWLRVLTPGRYGHRIPIDAMDRAAKERFVGHFPRGLDLWLPIEDGVLEMHLSVAVDGKQVYRARGLSLQPTTVRRFLERVDIRYDPRRPAPLETRLSSGDRVQLGEGEHTAMLEFIMLPREER